MNINYKLLKMKIVKYKPDFANEIADLFYNSVHYIASDDYTEEELNVWTPSPINYKLWKKKLDKTKPFVAIDNEKIVGFAELELNGHIDCFYVHKDFKRLGIGKKILIEIEKKAILNGCLKLFAEVSITAKPFFLSQGFISLKPNLVKKEKITLKNYIMEKKLI